MIPKKIHYCWFGKNPLPGDVKRCIESWRKYCPDYEIIEWNENNFDINCHDFVKKAYEAKCWAFVSDYARLRIIYENGGIYLDTDVELLKSLDSLLEKECYVGVQQAGHYIATGLGFGAVQFHPMVKSMLDQYEEIVFNPERKKELACPHLNTKAFKNYGFCYQDKIQVIKGASVFPPRYFDPYSTGDTCNLRCSDTISIHHYSATWTNGRQRCKRKLARLIGENRILWLKSMKKKWFRRKA